MENEETKPKEDTNNKESIKNKETKTENSSKNQEESKKPQEVETTTKSSIDELKDDYEKAMAVYTLPTFEELNLNFQIEKIADIETNFLLLEVRKHMSEKLSTYLKLTETFINPSQAQMIVYHMIKTFTKEDQEKLREVYKKLAKIEIKVVELDLDFDEEKEAKFIKMAFEIWQEVKKDLLKIIIDTQGKLDTETKPVAKKYFG